MFIYSSYIFLYKNWNLFYNVISEGMKYQIPEQVEQKYMPPGQQRMSEHERYFQVK